MKIATCILLGFALLMGCSSDGSSGKGNSSAGNNVVNALPNNIPSSGTVCSDDVEFCKRADCRLCRYALEIVGEGEWPVMALGPEPLIAYYNDRDGDVKLARRATAGTWETESAWLSEKRLEEGSLQMATDAGGNPWITVADDDRAVTLIFNDGSGWNVEPIADVYDFAPIAIDSDGTPWIVHSPLTGGVAISGRIDGTWQTTVLDDSTEFVNARSIHADSSGVHVAWVDRASSELRYGAWNGESLESEVAMTGLSQNLYPLSVSLATRGSDIAIVANDRVAIRQGGSWIETRSDVSGDNNVLVDDGDGFTLVGFEFFGVAVAPRVGTQWPSQLVSTRCDSDALDAAVGPNGELFLVYWCHGEIEFMERSGMYNAGYATSCRELTTSLCDAALTCNPDASDVSGDLCLYKPSGRTSCINVPYCQTDYYGAVCGDASQDPSLVDDCAAAMPSECRIDEADGDGGVVLPEVCAFR